MTPMDTDERQTRFDHISGAVIASAFKVHNALGWGLSEKCYENSLVHDLRKAGWSVEQQKSLTVWYDGVVVGEYVADLVVEGVLLVELKAARAIDDAHVAQTINYLAITRLPVGLILNFTRKVEIKRIAGPTL